MKTWRPSQAQRREFAERMQNDPEFKKSYEDRKSRKADKRRATSKFDYEKAGGYYMPTQAQNDAAWRLAALTTCPDKKESCNLVMIAYGQGEKVHHDHIHVVNEFIRSRS